MTILCICRGGLELLNKNNDQVFAIDSSVKDKKLVDDDVYSAPVVYKFPSRKKKIHALKFFILQLTSEYLTPTQNANLTQRGHADNFKSSFASFTPFTWYTPLDGADFFRTHKFRDSGAPNSVYRRK